MKPESDTPLFSTVRFLVNENRTSRMAPEKRESIIKKKRFGRILHFLFPFGFSGSLVFAAFAVIKPPAFSLFRSLVVEDHASGVVRGSIDRVTGVKSAREMKKAKPGRFSIFAALLRNFTILRRGYEIAGIKNFSEFARISSLLHFYAAWKAFFRKRKPSAVLLARTNDPKRLALGAAANERDIPVLAFTVERVALRNQAPFRMEKLFCWTKTQAELAASRSTNAVRMPVPFISAMKIPVPDKENAVCGLLLNAKCNVPAVENFLRQLHDVHGLRQIRVRPHPGFDEKLLKNFPHSIICDWRQPLPDFLSGLDMSFSLNSSAIIEALLQGVPVVYVSGLDVHPDDTHGFVSDGIVPRYSESFVFPDSLNQFYGAADFTARWNTDEFTTDRDGERKALAFLAGAAEAGG